MTEMTFKTGDGCDIAYRWDGPQDAPTLLLSNSLGTSMAMWEPQLAAFGTHFRVLRYDSRGHGRSDAPPGAYSMDRLGRDVIELLDFLGVRKAHVCGVSKGGMVAQWLGIREPHRVNRLVLANTSAYMGPPSNWDARIASVLENGMAPLAEASMKRWFTKAFRETTAPALSLIFAQLQGTDPQGYAGCCAAIRDMDMRRTVRLIESPVLVIGGTRDAATPPPHSEALAAEIPNGTLAMLDAAHLSNVEQAQSFTHQSLAFLQDA